MKKLVLVFGVCLSLAIFAGVANAATFTMSQTQLLGLYETNEDPTSDGTVLGFVIPTLGGVQYGGTILAGSSGIGDILIGANSTGTPFGGFAGDAATNIALGMGSLVGFDAYSLRISNNNENPWSYALYIVAGGTEYVSTLTEIAAGASGVLSLDLTGIGAGDLVDISDIGFGISADVPIAGYDHLFETIVTPVPEPASLLLLGSGLIGLAGLRRRRKA